MSEYTELLSSVAAKPERRLADVLDVPAVRPIAPMPDWGNDVAARFFTIADAAPDAPAIGGELETVSYGTLAGRVRGIAATVQARCAPGSRIAVLGDYDVPVVAALLGTLAAGCAYVPLDPQWPAARVNKICSDAAPSLVLCDRAHQRRAAALGLPVLCIEELAPSDLAPAAAIGADTLAYIIYTSGSAGTPRGVMQSHRGLLLQIARYAARLELNPNDRLSALSGYAFDAAVQDVFGALLTGASLYPVPARSLDALDRIVAAGTSVFHATPTVYRHLFGGAVNCSQDLGKVRWVVLGGEAARAADLSLFKSRFAHGARFLNGLGLTECTVALQFVADHDTALWGRVVPVGRAVPGIDVVLEDARGIPGWCGEIVLRGEGIAVGYWRDDAATQARFIREGDEIVGYRTGDMGWRLPGGAIAYRGRRDGQFQLRGVRVERGEIEQTVLACPGVVACAVDIHKGDASESRLVAYVEGLASPAQLGGLRAHLRTQLPRYLLPQVLMRLEQLPRLGNGKVDYAALPPPARDDQRHVRAPLGELEARLVPLWSELLGVDTLGVDEDFFALGGHSLMATRLIARVRDGLGVELPLISLFEHPTVQGMARAIATLDEASPGLDVPALIRQHRPTRINR